MIEIQLKYIIYVYEIILIHIYTNQISQFQSTVCANGEADIELFAEEAQIQTVTICSNLSRAGCTLKVPIHQRYQHANDTNKYMNITLPNPTLLLGCKKRNKDYRVSKLDLCSPCVEIVPKWREIPYIMVKNKLCYLSNKIILSLSL